MKYISIVVIFLTGCYQESVVSFGLQNCKEEMVSPYEFEDQVEVVRLYLVAEWCTSCSKQVKLVYEQDAESNKFAQMIILGEDFYGSAPSFEGCRLYADSHEIPQDKIFLDAHWDQTWKFLGIRTHGPDWMPWVAILEGSNIEAAYFNLLK